MDFKQKNFVKENHLQSLKPEQKNNFMQKKYINHCHFTVCITETTECCSSI